MQDKIKETINGLERIITEGNDIIATTNNQSDRDYIQTQLTDICKAIDLITELQIDNAKLEHSREVLFTENQIEISSNNDLRQLNEHYQKRIDELYTIIEQKNKER